MLMIELEKSIKALFEYDTSNTNVTLFVDKFSTQI